MTKKINYVGLLALMVVFSFFACKKDNKPKTLAVLTTATPTEVTVTGAKLSGTITNDGNSAITERGFVYSDVIETPTLANSKIVATGTGSSFNADLTGLLSGTTYHVRAYATNGVGTAYGNAEEFMTGNSAPIATGVSVTGTPKGDELLTGNYTYSDAESDAEAGSIFKWYMATDAAGTGETLIDGATEKTFRVQDAQQGKYIRFGVTPKAATGNQNGVEVKSAFVGAVGEATTVTFTYNGTEVTYGILTSATTQKKWLDRNLGAPAMATAYNDFANYGDAFQWGRPADGHQLTVRGPSSPETSGTATTTTQSPTDVPSTNLFIITGANSDWLITPNGNLWNGVDGGKNNPCPDGWRIPTNEEWTAEGITDAADGYSKLKLTFGGFRWYYDGTYSNTKSFGCYWTSTANTNPAYFSSVSYTYEIHAGFIQWTESQDRGSGCSCRCIKK